MSPGFFLFFLLIGCNASTESSGDASANPSDAAISSDRNIDGTASAFVPEGYVVVSDGSGFTPVNGRRTYDYGDWSVRRTDLDWSNASSIAWHWSPLEETSFTQEQKDAFIGARDGRFVADRTQILLVGSNGGVALVQYNPKRLLYYGNVGANTNPHSAELLPDGNIAVVSSSDQKLTVLSTVSSSSRSYSLTSAHGVLWDSRNRLLWAIGTSLKAYSYNGDRNDPQLSLESTFALPSDNSGHELFYSDESDEFYVTSLNWSGIFNTGSERFSAISGFTQVSVKGMSEGNITDWTTGNSTTAIAYTYPVADSRIANPSLSWWTETVSFFTADARTITRVLRGARIYKARF